MAASISRELENLFVPVLQNCVNITELKKVHTHVIKFSLSQSSFVVTKMVDLCDKHKDMEYANSLFKQVNKPTVFLCNAIIRTYTHSSLSNLAIDRYKQMLQNPETENPNRFTFPFVIKSCAELDMSKQIHAHVCKFGPKGHIVTENALIEMYTKSDNLEDAHRVFDEMPDRDAISWNCLISGYARAGDLKKARKIFDQMMNKTIVTWTAMISGYNRIGCYSKAVDIFRQMQIEGKTPDEISIVSILPAVAHLGALELGKWIHMYCDRNNLLNKTGICNALIEMYSKSGCITESVEIFDRMIERDVISYSTMINALANHGQPRKVIELFQKMRIEKIKPNAITFLGLLSACTHSGLYQEGLNYFDLMKNEYCISPGIEHYGCLVDLIGRSGRIKFALETINKMPMNPDSKIWGSLLSCCRTYSNVEVAEIAMENIVKLEAEDIGNYVLLSNIYADIGDWDGVSRLRKVIRSKSMKKLPGCSSIEVNNVVKEFVAGLDFKGFYKDVVFVLELLVWNQKMIEDAHVLEDLEE